MKPRKGTETKVCHCFLESQRIETYETPEGDGNFSACFSVVPNGIVLRLMKPRKGTETHPMEHRNLLSKIIETYETPQGDSV